MAKWYWSANLFRYIFLVLLYDTLLYYCWLHVFPIFVLFICAEKWFFRLIQLWITQYQILEGNKEREREKKWKWTLECPIEIKTEDRSDKSRQIDSRSTKYTIHEREEEERRVEECVIGCKARGYVTWYSLVLRGYGTWYSFHLMVSLLTYLHTLWNFRRV